MTNSRLTPLRIFKRLRDMARIGAGARACLLDGDLINQDQLGDLQVQLSSLVLDLANDLGCAGEIVKEWPHVFKTQ